MEYLKRRLDSMWRDRTGLGLSRLLALAGAGLVLAGVVLSLPFVLVILPQTQPVPGRLVGAIVAGVVSAALAIVAAFVPWTILSVAILTVAFIGSFATHFGWYLSLFLSSFPPFGMIGLGEALYAAAALGMAAAAFGGPPRLRGDLMLRSDGL